jgi:hypothetical protein
MVNRVFYVLPRGMNLANFPEAALLPLHHSQCKCFARLAVPFAEHSDQRRR